VALPETKLTAKSPIIAAKFTTSKAFKTEREISGREVGHLAYSMITRTPKRISVLSATSQLAKPPVS